MRLTNVQITILAEVHQRGGQVQSLLRLADELCLNYRWARACLVRMERAGLVTVERHPGLPLVITLKPCQGSEAKNPQRLRDLQRLGF